MEFKPIGNYGELGIEFLQKDGDDVRVSKDFCQKLICNIIKRSTKYFKATKEHIFIYGEDQLHSVVCPSIADLTFSYVMEHPLNRKPHGKEEYPGKCDYWISYRKYSFLMELKHSYWNYMNDPREVISNRFKDCINQLKGVKTVECRNLTINNGLIRIALQAIVFYEVVQKDIANNDFEKRDLKDAFEQLINNTALIDSNMRSLWLLHPKLIRPQETDNRYEIYPAVAFVGRVFNVKYR